MTALNFHRAHAPFPTLAPVATETELHISPELHTAAELMAARWDAARVHVADEVAVAAAVRGWVDSAVPGDEVALDAAASLALENLATTGSIDAALEVARQFVASYRRHPSNDAIRKEMRFAS